MEVVCPKCVQSYDVPDSFVGETIKCVKCGEVFAVEAPSLPEVPVEAPPEPEPEMPVENEAPEAVTVSAAKADVCFTVNIENQPPIPVRLESVSISFECIFKIVFFVVVSLFVIGGLFGLLIGIVIGLLRSVS